MQIDPHAIMPSKDGGAQRERGSRDGAGSGSTWPRGGASSQHSRTQGHHAGHTGLGSRIGGSPIAWERRGPGSRVIS